MIWTMLLLYAADASIFLWADEVATSIGRK